MPIQTIGRPELWVGFVVFVIAMLALDLGVLHRKSRAVSVREALIATGVWASLAFVFGAGIYWKFGSEKALEFATGYLIEKALAVDNVFIFAVLFGYFGVRDEYQHKVLFWGVFGALCMRALFIALGAALIARFHFVLYLFGAALVFTGIKLFRQRATTEDPGDRVIVRWVRRFLPMDSGYRGPDFLVRKDGRWVATPLMLVVIVLELMDLMFAIDSIPAIFAVTLDPFIVFTSNIFAILGLRSLYFVLARILDKFQYLKIGLAAVLCFVGLKMLLADLVHVSIGVSLGVVGLVLATAIGASLVVARNRRSAPPEDAARRAT
jgi:tellurite resistance protein TerC